MTGKKMADWWNKEHNCRGAVKRALKETRFDHDATDRSISAGWKQRLIMVSVRYETKCDHGNIADWKQSVILVSVQYKTKIDNGVNAV